MSLFGIEAPKMIVNIETTKDEVLLDYVNVLKDEPEQKTYDVKSVRTGKTVFTNAGKHWIFQIKLHLWKYGVDAETKYLELKSYEGTEVFLYRHRDGTAIADCADEESVFIITSVNEHYLERDQYRDYIVITFRSTSLVANNKIYYAQEYYEDFTGSVFDTELFEKTLLDIDEDELKLTAGYCINCTPEENARYAYKWFRLKIKNKANTNISVSANAKQGGSGKDTLIGFYDTTRYFAGIMISSSGGEETDWAMKILIANGDYPEYLQDITIGYNIDEDFYGYNAGVWNSFKIIYKAVEKKVYFYIKSGMTGNFYLINNTGYYVPEFADREFYCGVFGEGDSTGWSPDGQLDNLEIYYTPKPEE